MISVLRAMIGKLLTHIRKDLHSKLRDTPFRV